MRLKGKTLQSIRSGRKVRSPKQGLSYLAFMYSIMKLRLAHRWEWQNSPMPLIRHEVQPTRHEPPDLVTYWRTSWEAHCSLRIGNLGYARELSHRLVELAPTVTHRTVAGELVQETASGDIAKATRMAAHVSRGPDLYAEKVVSRRHRYLWICNPKVASRSIIAHLRRVDPSARLVSHLSVEDVYSTYPETADYFTFAFVRDPFDRSVSFYRDKFIDQASFRRYLHDNYLIPSGDVAFAEVCRWLNTPYGQNEFADRHWLSQKSNLGLDDGGRLDFIGRLESFAEDFAQVVREIGLPAEDLPRLNVSRGTPSGGGRSDAHLTDETVAELTRRYSDDFELGGYSSERRDLQSAGPAA